MTTNAAAPTSPAASGAKNFLSTTSRTILFGRDRAGITRPIANAHKEGEAGGESTYAKIAQVQKEGDRVLEKAAVVKDFLIAAKDDKGRKIASGTSPRRNPRRSALTTLEISPLAE